MLTFFLGCIVIVSILKRNLLFFSFLVLVGLWELISRSDPHLIFVLPSPSAIASTLWEMKERFAFHTWVTAKEMLLGFVMALITGLPLAWVLFRVDFMRFLLQPLFVVIQCIPMFALAPIMVIWFGWNQTAIIVPTALMIFFPLTLNFYQGLRATPKDLLDLFQINNATGWQTLIKLRIPAAMSHIFAGLKLSASIAGIGAVAGEWAGAQQGLGVLMLESRRNSDLTITFSALCCLSLLTLSFYGIVLCLESFWKRRLRVHPAILTFCLLLCSCSQKESSAPPHSTAREITLLLDWLPNPNHIPLYVGLDRGFFQEENIQLTLLKLFDNGGGISYLSSKKTDLILGHIPGALKACSLGANLEVVAELIPMPLRALIYDKQLPITFPKDLSGYRFGYCIGGHNTAFLDFLLKQGEIHPLKKINVSVDLIAALGTHTVDCIYGGYWNIEPYQLRALGMETSYFPIEEFGVPPYQELVVLTTRNLLPSSVLDGFRRALQKSIHFCQKNVEESFSIYLDYNPDKSQQTKNWELEAWKTTVPLFPQTQEIDRDRIALFYAWQIEQGLIPVPSTPECPL